MISSQQVVLRWVEYAATGAILLQAARIACYRVRQPADRINLILMTLVVTAAVPLVASWLSLPSYHLNVFHPNEHQADAVATTASQTPASPDATHEPVLNRQEYRAPPVEPTAMEVSVGHRLISPAPAALSERFDAWLFAVSALLVSYSLAAGFFIAEWLLGVYRLRRIVVRGRPVDRAVNDLWMQLTQGRGGSVRVLISPEITVPLL